ncbi:MAG TPA: hypothetical protein ENG42_01965 [Candidatus Aenigmarchaeota archaeon]|nr:MAG: hypothetical protein DRP03_03495 [Candidatus Aenigmarchaeota archaeon]HDD46214.1 hypothetical protein [Candidatus Aenigmarchaeota archaeon]
MKKLVILIILTSLLAFSPSSLGIENNKYVGVPANETKYCDFLYLPQDLASAIKDGTEVVVSVEDLMASSDIKHGKFMIAEHTVEKIPICFYYHGKPSKYNFYKVRVYSKELKISKEFTGGFCITKYRDVDIVSENGTDVCKIINEHSDIFDIRPALDSLKLHANEEKNIELYVAGFADVDIKIEAYAEGIGILPKSTYVKISKQFPIQKRVFKIKSSKDGEYKIVFRGYIEGCTLKTCMKETYVNVFVSNEIDKGFKTSIVPRSINIEQGRNAWVRVLVTNYENSTYFNVSVSYDDGAIVSPTSKYLFVERGETKSVLFKIALMNKKIYRIEFKISSRYGERFENAYISTNELVNDIKRYAESVIDEVSDEEIKNSIKHSTARWIDLHNKVEYMSKEDIKGLADIRHEIENAKKKSTSSTVNNITSTKNEEKGTSNVFYVPLLALLIIIAAISYILIKRVRVKQAGDIYFEGFS